MWWIVHNQLKKGLLLSSPVKFFKAVNIWHSYGQKNELCCTFSSSFSSVVAMQAHKVHKTTTFLLVALPNIHRFKKNSLADSTINLS